MNQQEVQQKVNIALNNLITHDAYLLEINANERAISHRLAIHLESEFPGWNVDCEYNRNIDDPKRLELPITETDSTDTEAKTVFPDIIIHHRGINENLLVIEMKKSTSTISDDFDRQKLRAFKGQLNYQYAAFVKVKTHGDIDHETDWQF